MSSRGPLMHGAWLVAALLPSAYPALGADKPASERFRKDIQPILAEYCHSCHGDGSKKGNVALDEFKNDEALANPALWFNVLKNVRAGIMPPPGKDRPSAAEIAVLEKWITADAFGIDPANPDPGRVTLRRLNRTEYRNTIRDLTGVEFRVDDEFPTDDTGYGFDNIGDVLSVSPLLLEKYLEAAKTIAAAAVPLAMRVPRESELPAAGFRDDLGLFVPPRSSFYKEGAFGQPFAVPAAGGYTLHVDMNVRGEFDFDPGRCEATFMVDGTAVHKREFGWENNKTHRVEMGLKLDAGEHTLRIELRPLVPVEKKKNSLDMAIGGAIVQGPMEPRHWVKARNVDKFFPLDDVPAGKAERIEYTKTVLRAFAGKAFRRPVDEASVDRLAAIAERVCANGRPFAEGIRQAMVAVMASPRFLFRVEGNVAGADGERFPLIDEYSLASRLSYFLWSTMPDEELMQLAAKGGLRRNLAAQVKRMVADPKADSLVRNFVGQWLQARDIEGVVVTPGSVVDRATIRKYRLDSDAENREIRRAMRLETERYFEHILRGDRSVLELIDSDYTFLDERLAKYYGIEGVQGPDMRKVTLPAGSPRGGMLTQGTVLMVTSNPTRTSPVKRGLFVLENLLGSPPPPPPEDVPELEETLKAAKKELSIREALEIHRNKPLCASCHSRMDPLGLALENFNALGMWRDKDAGQAISAGGKLVSGEAFKDVAELKKVIAKERGRDFQRCLTEKLLTYAIGRGTEYYDVQAVDQIVDRLGREDGKFSALLMGVIESAPFQRRRANPQPKPEAKP